MCIAISPHRWCPCGGADSHSPYVEDGSSSCASVLRVALSIASIAIGILSTTVFLATDSMIALGISIALGIAAICLWPKRSGGGGPPPPHLLHVHNTFGAALPLPMPPPTGYYAPPPAIPFISSRPVAPLYREPIWSPPMAPPPPPLVTFAPPESRVHVGGGGRSAAPAAPSVRQTSYGGEERVRVGPHDRAAPGPAFHPHQAPPLRREIPGGAVAAPSMAAHPAARHPIPPPPVAHAAGEQRIPVGRGGHIDLGGPPPSGEDRIPVGRGRR